MIELYLMGKYDNVVLLLLLFSFYDDYFDRLVMKYTLISNATFVDIS